MAMQEDHEQTPISRAISPEELMADSTTSTQQKIQKPYGEQHKRGRHDNAGNLHPEAATAVGRDSTKGL